MRTQDEILVRISEVRGEDILGFQSEVLKFSLTYENVQPFLKQDHELDEELWSSFVNDDVLLADMKDYMGFALEKAHSHRGISASRSVDKMKSYLWLLDNPPVYREFIEAGYAQYGVPQLMVVCKAYDIDVPEYMQSEIANMAQGKSCVSECDDGCGQ